GMSGCVTDWKRRVTASALTGEPVSYPVTWARNAFGPAKPGVIVSETRVVVAKSAPVAEPATGGGPVAADAAATGGLSPVSTPVRTKTPSAKTVSAVTNRRRG